MFASTVGTPMDDHNVRHQFRVITEAAGLGSTWVSCYPIFQVNPV